MQAFWQHLPRPFSVLAPMDAVTDTVFRHVVQRAAPPDVYFTEFTNVDSYCSPKGRDSTATRLFFTSDEQPIVAQIWGTNPEHFAVTAKAIARMGFAGIDINMGCPAKDVIKRGAGAGLIETPGLAAEIIAATKQGGLPVSVKTRIGFKTQKTEEWIGFLLRQDITALTVHARTQKEQSLVPARWEEVAKAVRMRDEIAPQTLIVGNGDVRDRPHGLELARQTGADGIMVGRGVFTNVFCFERIPKAHSRQELLDMLRLNLDLFEATWPDRPFAPLKRFFKIYVRDFDGASDLRVQLMNATSIAEARIVLGGFQA
jgi:tRNA-dihydrouridine synthase